jgi:hypothetical protein
VRSGKSKLSFDGDHSGSEKRRLCYGGPCGGVWRSLRSAGLCSLESDGRFCVDAFDRNLASVAVKMLSLSFYKCYSFTAIC